MSLDTYLDACREDVLGEIRRIVPTDGPYAQALYGLMLDYPLRAAKGLRPALAIATCRAFGGRLDSVLRSAAVLELYHNAFLIHDDIEDESELRRGGPTLHRAVGVPVAVNVGDAMLCLSLQPLLDNIGAIGLGPALHVLQAVARMNRESVEGQALELDWVRAGRWDLSDDDYVRMVVQKTGWYSFITPVRVGALCAGAPKAAITDLEAFALHLSVAFQIQDDLLNLDGEVGAYGKEIGGDLWEGKRTLILLHALRGAAPDDRREALRILALPRPGPAHGPVLDLVADLIRQGQMTEDAVAALLEGGALTIGSAKTEPEVRWLWDLVRRTGGLEYAREVASAWAAEAALRLEACRGAMPPSIHRDVLDDLVAYVHQRER